MNFTPYVPAAASVALKATAYCSVALGAISRSGRSTAAQVWPLAVAWAGPAGNGPRTVRSSFDVLFVTETVSDARPSFRATSGLDTVTAIRLMAFSRIQPSN